MADYQTATNPQTGERLVQIGGLWKPLEASATNPQTGAKAYKVGGQWLQTSAGQPTSPGIASQALSAIERPIDQAGMALPLMAADAGVAAKNLVTGSRSEMPSQRFERWLDERTATPQGVGKAAETVSSMLVGAGVPGGGASDAEAAVVKAGPKLEKAEQAAQEYIARNTSLAWEELPQRIRSALTEIAKDSKSLAGLNPQAVEREARLGKLGLPATRGQVSRNLSQLTREENLTKTDAGAGIRDIYAEQDRILHQHLDTLRGETKGTAETRQQLGKSVQGAARSKLDALRQDYQQAYDEAKKAGAGLEAADITPLREWLKNPTNARNAGYLKSAIADYVEKDAEGKPLENGRVTINDLEEIRKEAAANAKKPGPEGHFAKEATKVIDGILDESGSAVYKTARTKFKAVKDEFDRQGKVAALVKQKGMSRDRAVALEDTFDNVILKGSAEQLAAVRDTLTKGGSDKTRKMGEQAWNDLRGATVDYLKAAAKGSRGIEGERGQAQFNSSFIEKLDELDKDGKLEILFGKEQVEKLRELAQATRDVRTKPAGRIAGSDTAPRILNFLEKLSMIPYVGKPAAGVASVGRKVLSLGSEAREGARAQLSDLGTATVRRAAREQRRKSLLGAAATGARAGAAGRYTLQNDEPQ